MRRNPQKTDQRRTCQPNRNRAAGLLWWTQVRTGLDFVLACNLKSLPWYSYTALEVLNMQQWVMAFAVSAASLSGQIPTPQPAPNPSFDVASIKLHPQPITASYDPMTRGSEMVCMACSLRDMITAAYSVRDDQLLGGPNWLTTDHYDLEAKASGDTPLTRDRGIAMLQSLLTERFQLKVHRETREMQVYELVIAKNGPKFKRSPPDATGGMVTRSTAAGSQRMEATRASMERLARRIGNSAGRPVLDKTGLEGDYAFTLEWTQGDRAPDAEVNVPSIFTAVQEQLGLKLEPAKDPIEMLVIDRAEKPSEN